VSAIAIVYHFCFFGIDLESAGNKLNALGYEFPKWIYVMDLYQIDWRVK
jgi:hypothetical protein